MSNSAVWEDCTVLALAKEMVMGGVAGTLLVTGHEMEKKLRDAPVSTIMGGPVGGNCMDVVAWLTEVVLNRCLGCLVSTVVTGSPRRHSCGGGRARPLLLERPKR